MCSGEISTGRDNAPDAADKDSDLFLSDIKVLSEIWANRQGRDHSTPESELADQLATEQDAEGENEDDAVTPLFNLWAQFTDQRPIFQQKCRKTKKQPRKRHKADITQDHETEESSRKRHKADIAPAYEVPSLNGPLQPSPDTRNRTDDAHYQELELDLMNKARYKTQTVDEFLEDFLVKLETKQSRNALQRLHVLAGLRRLQNHMANDPGYSPYKLDTEDIGFSSNYFFRLIRDMPFLQQVGTGLKRWKGTGTFQSDKSGVTNLLRWKLSSLLDEIWFITEKDWKPKVANKFEAYICSLSGLTDSRFRLDPGFFEEYRRRYWHMDEPHVCKACNCTMLTHYQLVTHRQHGCRGACSRCDDLGLACHEWTRHSGGQ